MNNKCDANDIHVKLGLQELGQQINNHLSNIKPSNNNTIFDNDDELSIIFNRLLDLIEPLDFEKILKEQSRSENEFNSYKQSEGKIKLTRDFKIDAIIKSLLQIASNNGMEIALLYDDITDEKKVISIYNGKYFIPVAKKLCRDLLKYVAIKSSNVGDHNYTNFRMVDNLYNQFMEECPSRKRYQHSNNRVLFNLDNCTLEFSEKNHFTVLKHNSKHYLSNQQSFIYDKDAVAVKFLQYLLEVLGDQECSVKDLTIEQLKEYCKNNESIQLLKEFCGSIFGRWLNLQYIMFLYGRGSNGKSCLLNVLTALLGRYNLSSISLENFNKDCYLAQLDNKLLNCNSDVGGTIYNQSTVKKIASKEILDAKKLYHDPKDIDNYGRILFNTNEKPRIKHGDDALSNRFIFIVFDKVFNKQTANTNLHKEIIDTELSGVLNWIIEGYNDICENRKNGKQYSSCKKSEQFSQEYRNSLDSVMMFMASNGYKVGNTDKIDLQSLLKAYKEFCKDGKYDTKVITDKELSQYLQKKLGYTAEKKDGDNTKIFYDIIDDNN
jgi:putative DNA primase/helicase